MVMIEMWDGRIRRFRRHLVGTRECWRLSGLDGHEYLVPLEDAVWMTVLDPEGIS